MSICEIISIIAVAVLFLFNAVLWLIEHDRARKKHWTHFS